MEDVFLEQDDYTLPNCGERSAYTDSVLTDEEDISSKYMNG